MFVSLNVGLYTVDKDSTLEGEAMVETWQAEPGRWLTETRLRALETQAEPKKPGNTEGPGDQKEPWGRAAKVKPGCWRTEAELVHLRTEVEPKGWVTDDGP